MILFIVNFLDGCRYIYNITYCDICSCTHSVYQNSDYLNFVFIATQLITNFQYDDTLIVFPSEKFSYENKKSAITFFKNSFPLTFSKMLEIWDMMDMYIFLCILILNNAVVTTASLKTDFRYLFCCENVLLD